MADVPVIAVRLSPTVIEWIFQFEMQQHKTNEVSTKRGSSARGYTRHIESAWATILGIVTAIKHITDVALRGQRDFNIDSGVPKTVEQAVLGIKHLVTKVRTPIFLSKAPCVC